MSIARDIRRRVAMDVAALVARGVRPGLAAILVGDDPASATYVRSKGKACDEAGIHSVTLRLPESTEQAELLRHIDQFNADPEIHGILVQTPLPRHIDAETVMRCVHPSKDVDGFHPVNVGKMLIGQRDGFLPSTPAGIREMLRASGVETTGKDCVIVGRSNIVGKPMAAILMQDAENANCTVTVCHRHTHDLASHTRRAEILIVAAGRPHFITGEMIRPGAVVIDVGINRVPDNSAKSGYRIVGDIDFDSAREVASKITPVPGGVGPMTIAMLLSNTVRAATRFADAGLAKAATKVSV